MKITKPVTFLALSFVAIFAVGCATPASVDSKSSPVLRAMSHKLSSADQLAFTAVRKIDSQLIENPAVIVNATIVAILDRPDQAKVTISGEGKSRTFYLSKNGSVIHDGKSGLYARMPGKRTIDKSLDAAALMFDVHIPIQDFLSDNPYRGFHMGSDSIVHAGTGSVGGQACDILRGSREDLEWKLWIGSADQLPRRLVATVTALEGRDHLVIDFKKWDLAAQHPAGSLTFKPAKGDREIQFLPPEEATAE